MQNQRVFFINIPRTERAEFLLQTYGKQHKENLKESVNKISKRLGPLNTKIALESLDNDDLLTVAEISLIYYDKSYSRGVNTRNPDLISLINLEEVDHVVNSKIILNYVNDFHSINIAVDK